MAKSSKPKEIVVVGSKIKEVVREAGLSLQLDDLISGRLSWDVELTPVSTAPPPGYALSLFDDFEPLSFLTLPAATLTENPLGITIAVNDNVPEVGDEVLVGFIAGDPSGAPYHVELYLHDPTGAAINAVGLMTPLDLALGKFETATLSLSDASGPIASADVDSLTSLVVPEPTGLVLLVSMVGTYVVGKWWRR